MQNDSNYADVSVEKIDRGRARVVEAIKQLPKLLWRSMKIALPDCRFPKLCTKEEEGGEE